MSFIVYIFANRKGNVLYAGFTDKLETVIDHTVGVADVPVRMVYYERCRDLCDAAERLLDISARLQFLLTGFIWRENPGWEDLRPVLLKRLRQAGKTGRKGI
jgi:predicted GIY-YIG superfamily endonuclease